MIKHIQNGYRNSLVFKRHRTRILTIQMSGSLLALTQAFQTSDMQGIHWDWMVSMAEVSLKELLRIRQWALGDLCVY